MILELMRYPYFRVWAAQCRIKEPVHCWTSLQFLANFPYFFNKHDTAPSRRQALSILQILVILTLATTL